MNKFSEAYDKARSTVDTEKFAVDAVEKLRTNLKEALAQDGPASGKGDVLNKYRAALVAAMPNGASNRSKAIAEVIANAANAAARTPARAATLKMLKHFYCEPMGKQEIWIYAPPKSYAKWVFDELDGTADQALKAKLEKDDEVYSQAHRGLMATAVSKAREAALHAVAKLGEPDDDTKAMIKKYFADEDTKDADTTAIASTLLDGYKKIAAACNSNQLIFSDEPLDRNSGGWKDWAFVYSTEAMRVVYLQGAWLSKAEEATDTNKSPLWRCARTIVHELSHKEVKTKDVAYGPSGLKPAKASLTAALALINADSWAYFAIDLKGQLGAVDKANPLTSPLKSQLVGAYKG